MVSKGLVRTPGEPAPQALRQKEAPQTAVVKEGENAPPPPTHSESPSSPSPESPDLSAKAGKKALKTLVKMIKKAGK